MPSFVFWLLFYFSVHPALGLLSFLNLWIDVFHQFWNVLCYCLFDYCFCSIFSPLSSGPQSHTYYTFSLFLCVSLLVPVLFFPKLQPGSSPSLCLPVSSSCLGWYPDCCKLLNGSQPHTLYFQFQQVRWTLFHRFFLPSRTAAFKSHLH